MGVSCTYAGPSHKRGPPKGYILALERRLHQVEALLGTVISSDDPRARGLVNDLSRDQLAAHIIRRVKVGPFGPRGRLQQPFGSTKEDFLAAIMTGPGDDSPSRYGEDNYALVSPDRDWQDRLQALLNKPANVQYSNAPAASAQYALPSFRQLNSPAPAQQQYQQPSPSHTHHPQIQTANLSVPYSAKLESSSPVPNPSMLAPIHQSYQQQSAQPQGPYSQRLSWDGFNGYQRMGDAGSDDGDHSAKGRYELGPSDPGMPMGARDYQLQRCQDNTS